VNYYQKKKESAIIKSHFERTFEKFHVFSKAFQHQEAGDEGLMQVNTEIEGLVDFAW